MSENRPITCSSPEVRQLANEIKQVLLARDPDLRRQPDARLLTMALKKAAMLHLGWERWEQKCGRHPHEDLNRRMYRILESAFIDLKNLANVLNSRKADFGYENVPEKLNTESDAANRLFMALPRVAAKLQEEWEAEGNLSARRQPDQPFGMAFR